MRTDLNFEAESFAGYDPSQNEGFDPFMPYGRPPGSHRWGFGRHSRRWPWLQTGPGSGGHYEAPFYESEADLMYETGPAGSARDRGIVTTQIGRSVRDENKLTDAVFYERHPEWKGKALKNASLALRGEWVKIRDGIVRPLLKSAKPAAPTAAPTPVPPRPTAPTPPPVQPAAPVKSAKPSAQPGAGILGYNKFDNIRQYRPTEYQAALAAQAAFQKVRWFLPYYQKIMNAVPNVSIGLDSHGLGKLVFYIDKRAFTEIPQSIELRNKVLETIGSGSLGAVEFSVDMIGLLGLGVTIIEIAHGIENERKLGGVGPEADKWRREQAIKFVIGLVAEDLSRQDLRGSHFIYRNARDLANEIMADFTEFQPRNYQFVHYLLLEDQLWQIAQDRGYVPDVLPPDPPIMNPR
jgi:hypothetical protein